MAESWNNLPHYASLIRQRVEAIRHEDSEALRGFLAQESPVDTGALRDSWKVVHQGDNTDSVETDRPYAAAVDLGHHTAGGGFVPGQHFVPRAVARLRRKQAGRRTLF